MRARGFTRAVVAALTFAMLTTPNVWADKLTLDGDNLVPVSQQTLAFGTVCLGQTTTKGVLFVVDKTGNAGDHYANGANVVVTAGSLPSGFSSTSASITIPAGWNSTPNNQNTTPATLNVTFTASALGAISVNIGYDASGNQVGGGTLAISRDLAVTANVVTCDSAPPVLSLPADITVEATSAAGASVSYTASATDANPAHPSVTCAPASGSTFPFGVTTVNCSSTDAVGNTANGSFTITVADTTPPALSGTPSSFAVEAIGPSGATATYTNPAASDLVDGSVAVGCVPVSGSTFALGVTTVGCSATDSHGNTGTSSFTITVQDTTSPILVLPGDFTAEATGPSGAAVTFAPSATDLVDGSVSVSCDADSGDTFPLGVTTVSCSATDAAGNPATGSFTITVEDTTAPELTLPDDQVAEATGPGGAAATFSTSATDLVDGAVDVSCDYDSGETFALGETIVTCSATDAAGNISSGSFFVTVVDTTPPLLALPADQVLEATGPAGAVATYSASATDLVDGPVAVDCLPASGSTFALGVITVYCSATDAAGNSATGSLTITVVDTTPPALSLPDDMTVEATGPAGAVATYSASATDLVDGSVSVDCSPASGSTFALGLTTVNCSATDSHSNTATGSFSITVEDTTPPAVTVPADQVLEATGPSGAAASFLASAADIVDGSLVASCAPISGSTFPLGVTTVTCSSTDSHGNTGSDSFTVTVQDTIAPALTVPADMVVGTTNPAGAAVTFTPAPSATDAVDPTPTIVCSPASGATFPIGLTTVHCTATDDSGNSSAASFHVTVDLYAASFKSPIDAAPTLNLAKAGRVVPIKVEVFKNGTEARVGSVTIKVFKTGTQSATGEDPIEAYAAGASNSGTNFRWDASGDFWIYNLDTSSFGMSVGNVYRVEAWLDGNLAGYCLIKIVK